MNDLRNPKPIDLLFMIFSFIFASASLALFYLNSWWALLTFAFTFLSWIPSIYGGLAISFVALVGLVLEVLYFHNVFLMILWIVIAWVAFFLHLGKPPHKSPEIEEFPNQV